MDENEDYLKSISTSDFAKSGLISFAILGAWDSRIGPHIKNVWLHKDTDEKPTDDNVGRGHKHVKPTKFLIKFILSSLLNGTEEPLLLQETMRGFYTENNPSNQIKTRITIMEKYECLLQSFLYLAPEIYKIANNSKSTVLLPHCLCIVFPLNYGEKFVPWASLLNNYFTHHLPYLRITHKKCEEDQIIMNYSRIIYDLLEVLIRIDTCSVSSKLCMKRTLFSQMNMPSTDRIHKDFLSTAIASHLMTFGRSLIIGTDINLINLMIRTLSIFVPAEKRGLCVELSETDTFNFSSNLMIQGICKDNLQDVDYTFWYVLIGAYPLTVIQMNNERVLQSGNLVEHLWIQELVHQRLLTRLYLSERCVGCKHPLPLFYKNVSISLDCVLKDGSHLGELTKCFVTKIIKTSGCARKWDIYNQFYEGLVDKAKLLILLTQQFTGYQKNYLDHNWKVSKSLLKEATQLKREGDFLIVLAVAEVLSPGIYGVIIECSDSRIADYNRIFAHL